MLPPFSLKGLPMTAEEKNRFEKMEQSVEDIKTDISVIRSALLGNQLSGDKGLVGQISVLKAEIEILKGDVKELEEEKVKNIVYIKIITGLSTVVVAGIIGFLIKYVFKT